MPCGWSATGRPTLQAASYWAGITLDRSSKGAGPMNRSRIAKLCSPALALALLTPIACPATAQAQSFQFGLVGDTGYSARGIVEFKRLITDINRADLEVVVHIGD